MIFFGHLGVGSTIALPLRKGLPRAALLVGTVLPDLIDKPLYYGLVLLTGKHAEELGLICGTRTFGHTALFMLTLWGAAKASHSAVLKALALGVATHLFLDGMTDYYAWIAHGNPRPSSFFWPFLPFPVMPHHSLAEHIQSWHAPFLLGSEITGALLLFWDFRQRPNACTPRETLAR